MRWFTILALALAIGLATAASPFASAAPDGLNRVAADRGFGDRAQVGAGPVAGYAAPGFADHRVAKGVAGFAGTLIVFALGTGVAAAVRRR
jgi:PDGLE domain